MVSHEDATSNEENELELLSELAIASNKIDWKPAILLSEVYIEKFAKIRVKQIVKNRKIKLDKKIERLTLNQAALFLYTLHEINSKQFTEIAKIQKQKQRIINPKKSSNIYFGETANNKYRPLIENAIKIISYLKDK